jgi:hypothetical protein
MTQNEGQKMRKCEFCNYKTKRVYDLKRHQNAKHSNLNIDILPRKNLCEKVHLLCEKVHSPGEKVHSPGEKVHFQNFDTKNKFICNKCNKIYKSNRYLIEHEKKCNGIDELTCPTCMKSFTSKQGKSNHIKRNSCNPRSIIHARKRLNNESVQININTEYNTTNITNQNNTTINNTHNIININNYGNERLDYLNYDKLFEILKTGYDVPRLLTKEIHFNKDFPENNNIKYKSEKSALIKHDDEFILEDLNTLAEELVNEKTSQIQKFAQENKEDICLKIDRFKYENIIELLLNFMLLKEPQEHYKIQIKKIKDMIKNS